MMKKKIFALVLALVIVLALEPAMAQAGSDYVALQRLTEEQQTLETKIEQKMDRWAELEEMAQRMRS